MAIGHVSTRNGAALLHAGVDGLCTVSAVMAADDPLAAAQELRTLIDDTLTRQEIK